MPIALENSTGNIITQSNYELAIEDGDSLSLTLRKAYVNMKMGALVCWGHPSFTNTEYANADIDPNVFAPTGLDTDDWAETVVNMGGKYSILTTKHTNGFCLWPTAAHAPGHAPYSIGQTSWYAGNGHIDVVERFVTSCRNAGIVPGFYFAMDDSTFMARTSIDNRYTCSDIYNQFVLDQIQELLTNYGEQVCLWIDGWAWYYGFNYITHKFIYDYIKSISPRTLVIVNHTVHPFDQSEIEEYENNFVPIPSGNTRLVEAVVSARIDNKWFYASNVDQSSTAYNLSTIRSELAYTNANGGTYLIAPTPDTTGRIPSAQKTFLGQIPE